ncbi:MAG TPA: YihY/virulence factor BrkB family protein [Solirubrobacteraceae bacterium]|nr:YihY/virulence factor BrkB family protein [Solirubrobacteraceae bacterium]
MAETRTATPAGSPPAGDRHAGDVPEGPTDLSAGGWKATLKRTVKEFQEDNLTDWAAALTYYAVLAIFPGLIVLVSILGLVGQAQATTQTMLQVIEQVAPGSAVDTFRGPIEGIVRDQGAAGTLLGVGLLGAIWSASGYIGAFFRASDAVWDVEEGRSVWKLVPLRVGVTVLAVLALAVFLSAMVVTGPVAEAIGSVIGLGGTAVTVWGIAKWPVLLLIVMGIVAALYHVSPNVRHPRFRWLSPGGAAAVMGWIVVSGLFGLYVANFGSYDATYGSLGGVVVFLLWLWLTNVVLLFGAELNAELERSRQIAKGVPPDQEPFLPPRQPAKEG